MGLADPGQDTRGNLIVRLTQPLVLKAATLSLESSSFQSSAMRLMIAIVSDTSVIC